jgi:hypothetical protein
MSIVRSMKHQKPRACAGCPSATEHRQGFLSTHDCPVVTNIGAELPRGLLGEGSVALVFEKD